MIDPAYTVDIDTPKDWARSEWLVWHSDLDIVYPGHERRPIPDQVDLVVFDFDGVMTDNRVWVDQDGREMVAANRSDSLGLSLLRERRYSGAGDFNRDEPGCRCSLPQAKNGTRSGSQR